MSRGSKWGVLNRDRAAQGETVWLRCCWDDCQKQGVTLYQSRYHAHARGLRCDDPLSKHPVYVFCSSGHLNLFMNGHHDYGNLPSGSKGLSR